jgi:hypothetical protein
MLEMLAGTVAFLLVAPLAVIPAVGALLILAGLARDGRRRVRARFTCPWTRRAVTTEFLVSAAGAHPSDVTSCTAFPRPSRVTCHKACAGIADVRWGVSRGLFPGWAMTADGPVTWEQAGSGAGR